MITISPELKSSGIWTLAAPFNTLLVENLIYTCASNRGFAEIIADGGDVYEDYYSPKQIDVSKYEQDVLDGASIVGLQSASGVVVYVPTSYIISYPGTGGVPYRGLILGIDIGVVPKSLELAFLKQKLIDTTKEVLGIDAKFTVVNTVPESLIPRTAHNSMENIRQNNITEKTTDRAKYLEAKKQVEALQLLNKNLEDFIKANITP